MYELNSKKTIILAIVFILVSSLIFGLVTMPSGPHPHSSNEFEFSELFNKPFHKFPGTFTEYSDSKDYVDSVLSSSDLKIDPKDIIGLFRYGEENVILIKSNEDIIEIIANEEASIQKINVLELRPVSSKEFLKTDNLMQRTVIELSELEIPLMDSNDPLVFSVLEISHESWENKTVCIDNKNNYMHVEGMYFIDSSDNVTVTGTSSEVLSNCILIAVSESSDQLQNDGVFAAFSNSAKWESEGLLITSKSTRESQILVDRYLNIETWVTEDSWIGIG